MIEALKPCPFCGHKTPEFERMGTSRQSCIVVCGSCGCRHESSDEGDRCGQSWNERAADAALAQAEAPADEWAAFEAWCCKRWGGDRGALTLHDSMHITYANEYANGHVQFAWAAWQARAASAPAAPGWLPIETAPRDGLLVLLCTNGGIVFVGKMNKHLQLWVDDEGRERFRTVSYWMPLPAAPKEPQP